MEKIGKYIYGIINSNTKLASLANEETYTISFQDISAVVSDLVIVDYTHMTQDASARLLIRHQMVVEKLMPEHTIIPVKLGTFAADETEVKDILHRGYNPVKDILKKIVDKIEIDVAATWSDFSSILRDLGEEKEIKEFKKRFLVNTDKITIDDQMKAGVMVKCHLDRKREKNAFEIQQSLNEVSGDSRAHELMDDKMVINTAFLVDKARQKDFYRKVEELNTEFTESLNFRCVGPLPPYSFCTLEIKKMQFNEIDWARKKLSLGDWASNDEIKKAYKRAAFSSHPDKNPNTPDIEKEFEDVKKAYKTLLEYGMAVEQTGPVESYSFNEGEFKKNAILVRPRE